MIRGIGRASRPIGLGLGAFLALLSTIGCTSGSQEHGSLTAPAVSDDRSLDVSYADDVVEVSFARLGHPFRAMHALVMRLGTDGWTPFGVLRTFDSNTVGALTTEPLAQVELLDGVNTAAAPDRYRAPDLPVGQYLVCAQLVGGPQAVDPTEVCGTLDVPRQ